MLFLFDPDFALGLTYFTSPFVKRPQTADATHRVAGLAYPFPHRTKVRLLNRSRLLRLPSWIERQRVKGLPAFQQILRVNREIG